MKHSHHSCVCSHDDLRFCKTCKVVHCLGCNQEWVTRTSGYWYSSTYPWSYTIGGNSYLGGLEKKYTSGDNPQVDTLTLSAPQGCSHKD